MFLSSDTKPTVGMPENRIEHNRWCLFSRNLNMKVENFVNLIPLRLLSAALLVVTILSPMQLAAQEPDQTHPYLEDRFMLAVGAFARQQDFKIGADGTFPEEEIDFDETLGVDDDDISSSLTFRWNFGEKWSLWGQAWKVNAGGGAVLTEDVEFEDLVFKQGSLVAAGVNNDVLRVFFGRELSTGPRHEFGLGAGFHWLKVDAYIEGEAFINDIASGFQRGAVDASAPMPNIGGWYYFSPSKRWLFEARLDWLEVSVGDYSGGLWNSSVGVQFQAFKHLGFSLNYQYFSLNADVESEDWRGRVELRYRGPFLALTSNW
jgi:hypothetical protein